MSARVIRRQNRDQLEFFVRGSLRDILWDNHNPARVDRVLDLSWLLNEMAYLCATGVGGPWIEPETPVRLMRASFLLGIVHDWRLMREAAANPAIRWSAGFRLKDRLPGPFLADPLSRAVRHQTVPSYFRTHSSALRVCRHRQRRGGPCGRGAFVAPFIRATMATVDPGRRQQ